MGVAGAFLTLAAFNAFFFNMVNGRGWICVALVVFASWRPGKALLGALLFAFFDALQLRPFTVPHDAREPLQLRCTDGHRHLGVITDLGHVSSHVVASLQGCHALLLEANHDPDLLQASTYPSFLKQRVAGPWGHLANHAAAELLARVKHDQLSYVLAAHLSERNNTPELARTSLSKALGCEMLDIAIADPLTGSEWIQV